MAKKLNQFILDNDFDEIAIHCNAGISRSPAIGLCVAKILKSKAMEQQISNYIHFLPNNQILTTFDSFDFVCKNSSNNNEIIFRNLELYNFSNRNNNEIDKLIDEMIIVFSPGKFHINFSIIFLSSISFVLIQIC